MTAASNRTARWKSRKKMNMGVLQVVTAIGPLADRLAEDGFLAEWDTENRTEIERALAKMLAIYSLGDASPSPEDR